MKDVTFHEIIITRDDQKIVSADAHVYDVLGSYAVKPMNELIAIEDMDIYLNNIKNCDGNWYPSKILCPDTMYYTYMRAQNDNEKLIRLTIVNAHNLLNSHFLLMNTINRFQAQLDLYEDVFFEYDAQSETISVYNTVLADFDTGVYPIDEFEAILVDKAQEDQKQDVKGFFTQVKSGVGRSSTMVEGNLLNDDETITHTVLDEGFAFYDKDKEGVVGHIQIRRYTGIIKSTSLKHDSLTGLIDKTEIIKKARERIDDRRLEGTALAIIDVDFFKNINDTYGHQFGDEVIKRIADIISNEVGINGIAGRFGGDEFFVVFDKIEKEEQLKSILNDIKTKVSSTFPDKGIDKDNPLSVSIGAAVFPKDADNYEDLFMLADYCLYLVKERGRNGYIIYNSDRHGTLENIRIKQQNTKKINERDFSHGDIIVKMFDMVLHDEGSTIENYMSEFAEAFELHNVMLFVGTPFSHRCSAGSKAIKDQVAIDFVLDILDSETKDKYFSLGDFAVVNSLDVLPPYAHHIKTFLTKRNIYSLIIIRFYDKDDRECVFVISREGEKNHWNRTHFKYYRAFIDLLSLHSLGE